MWTRITSNTDAFLACFSNCAIGLLKLEFVKRTRLTSLNSRFIMIVAKCFFFIKSHLDFTD